MSTRKSERLLPDSLAWADLARRASRGLGQLVQAHRYAGARSAACKLGVELRELQNGGLTVIDLRWLVQQGYAVQALDRTGRRVFRQSASGVVQERSCFLLTDAGFAALAQRFEADLNADPAADGSLTGQSADGQEVPRWDRETHTLWWRGTEIKRFRAEAPYQEAILDAFEQRRWAACVAVTLPDSGARSPKARLHDAVKHLNRHLRPYLHFAQEGNGSRVRWAALPQ